MTNEKKKLTGKIIKISRQEGWGFISSKDLEFTRIFFHWTALRQDTLPWKELRTGMPCEFVLMDRPGRGYMAIKIKILERKKRDEDNVPPLSE